MPFLNRFMTWYPLSLARINLSEYTAGIVPLPGRAIPKISVIQFMELAVNMPAQEPQVGQAFLPCLKPFLVF
jgi:hypothetical protein